MLRICLIVCRAALSLGLLLALGWSVPTCAAIAPVKTAPSTAEAVAAHLGKGYELVKDQRYREAATEFQAVLALDPEHVRARYQLAVCWFALFQLQDARSEFERLRRITEDNAQVVYYLGRIDLLEANTDSAIREFKRVAPNPPFEDTAYYLGSSYLEKGDLLEAEKWLRAATIATPRDARVHDHLARVYQKQGRRDEAEKEYTLSSEWRAQIDGATHSAVACSRELETEGLREARPICQQLFDPRDPDKLTTLGLVYGQHGYFAEALEPLEHAAQLDPESSEVQHDLGLTYFRLRRYEEARAALEKAVALRPDFFGSTALLGATLYTLGEDDLSYPVLRHAHQLNPQDPDTTSLLFDVAILLAQKEFNAKKYAECLPYLKVAVETRPTEAEVHRRLAEVYGLLGRRTEANQEKADAERLDRARPR